MLAGPCSTAVARLQVVVGKLLFILILQRVQGRGRARMGPWAWLQVLHPPLVPSTALPRSHRPALPLDVFTSLID